MKIRAIERLGQIVRQLRSRFDRKALILMYHRVADVSSDPWALCVTPQHFAEHLEILRKHTRPMSLQQLITALRNGNIPRRSVVITFDDGYADNLYHAKPLLERYEIPATVFFATGYNGGEREFWWDELDRLLLQPNTLPDTYKLNINGVTYEWQLGEAANYSEEAYRQNRYWKVGENNPSTRHSLYHSLWLLLQPLMEAERSRVLKEIVIWAKAKPVVRPTHFTLSTQEICSLAQGKLVEVGAHTVTHSVLSTLPAGLQWEEIQRSKSTLEQIINRPVRSFSYPFGGRSDYTTETVSIVQEAGFTCACSNFAGVVEHGIDIFQMPRLYVQDWNGDEFARRLTM